MVTRFAYIYVWLLFILAALLFFLSLLLHLSVFGGMQEPFVEFGRISFPGTVILGITTFAFTKDGRWMDQIKTCPSWMWKTALAFGVYSLILIGSQIIFSSESPPSGWPIVASGFPLGFNAIALCIIYSVLECGYLTKSEVVKHTGISLLMVSVQIAAFLAYSAGYLHPQQYYKFPK